MNYFLINVFIPAYNVSEYDFATGYHHRYFAVYWVLYCLSMQELNNKLPGTRWSFSNQLLTTFPTLIWNI